MAPPNFPDTNILYTHAWTLTTPTNSDLSFTHVTPSTLSTWQEISDNPANNPFESYTGPPPLTPTPTPHQPPIHHPKPPVDDPPQEEAAPTKGPIAPNLEKKSLRILIHHKSSPTPIGMGSITILRTWRGILNLGFLLDKNFRGNGIGTLVVKTFAQVAREIVRNGAGKGLRVETGCMKANLPFRGMMGKLGSEETEEDLSPPDWGVVAEVVWDLSEGVAGFEELELRWDVGEQLAA